MAAQPVADTPAEGTVPFSQCDIWERQRSFYRQAGIQAWTKVPYYATSNPYVAHSYASVVLRFMQDCARAGRHRRLEPFYIVELGAGSGTFGFHMIKRLVELQGALRLAAVPFVYVMTDFVEGNVEFWRSHPAFRPYVAQGVLDFAVYDVEGDQELRLLESGAVLRPPAEPGAAGNPLIVVANYVFDTLPQDLFAVSGQRLQEGRTQRCGHADAPEAPRPAFAFHDIELPYYTGDEGRDFDAVLASYARQPGDGNLLFPVGALRCISRLIQWGGGRLLLLATDKGYAEHFDLFRSGEPHFVFHDLSFSLMVNFHAIGQYFQQVGGTCVHQPTQQGIATSLFLVGDDLDALPETLLAVADWLHSVSPGHLLTLYGYLERTKAACTLEAVNAALSLLRGDPHLWDLFADALPALANASPETAVRDLMATVEAVAAQYYFHPGAPDTLGQIGVFYHAMGDFHRALAYFHQSTAYFGTVDATLYNMALCHYALGEREQALSLFQAAVEVNPDYVMARGWISQLQAEAAREQDSVGQSVKLTPGN